MNEQTQIEIIELKQEVEELKSIIKLQNKILLQKREKIKKLQNTINEIRSNTHQTQ